MDKQKINDLCNGNIEASNLLIGLWKLFCVWDDCIDRDKQIDDGAINNAFLWAMFDLHENSFYKTYEVQLKPSIYACVASWITANKFEKTGDINLLHRSYVMRCSPYDLFGVIALLSGGFQCQLNAIEYFQSLTNDDTLQSYLQEHRR